MSSGLFLISVVAYLSSLGFHFVDFDDMTVLLAHPALYDETSLWSSLKQILLLYFPREEPLIVRDISWAIDARIFGFQNPLGYHLGNVLLHGSNAALLFLFLRKATKRDWFSLIIASVFAVHPIHVEPVCWVMGRKDLLAAFFMLLMLLLQSYLLEEAEPRRRRLLYLAGLLLYPLAVLSKFSAVTFFLVLILHRLFHPYLNGDLPGSAPLAWRGLWGRAVRPVLPHLAISLLLFWRYNAILNEFGVLRERGPGLMTWTHLQTLWQLLPLVLASYLRSLVWPGDYSILYPWPSVALALSPAERVLSTCVVLVLALSSVAFAIRRKDLLCYLLWFFALVLPYLNFVYIAIWRADRYVYLSMFCLTAIAVDALVRPLEHAAPRLRRWSTFALALYLLFLVAWALGRQQIFKTNRSLWEHEISREQPSLLAYQSLAKSLINEAGASPDERRRSTLLEQAEGLIRLGLARYESTPWVRTDYATFEVGYHSKLYYLQGQLADLRGKPPEEQLRYYLEAYTITPESPLNQIMLARTYHALARRAGAADREEYARRSLGYFGEYMGSVHGDPLLLEEALATLARNYEAQFPLLETQIKALRSRFFHSRRVPR